ncbi:carbon-nitrogen hydrolase family protein [Nonomuraea sp. MG754425]|uniref:carbon-nitrogen hydrolase family protein n=1 Tax=Nonomuraea sp. MG754425 TaxID=2570319 RepID=UPI001F41A418|nr:carbon-nitrogen hydrolase family protein [Nonomuraea sp. MG754425]MCF6471235.1 carbon-nitrogen hydrolase family protein [Nonomuraea sp. MG754425]
MKILLVQPPHWSPDGHANFDAAEELLAARTGDVALLPELVGSSLPRADYLARVRALAEGAGLTVVGGSHYDDATGDRVNRGAVFDARGTLLLEYDKAHPYGVELRSGVRPGRPGAGFELDGRRLHVLLCADLWYSASLTGREGLDAVLVPAFSVTRWDGPAPARELWQHMSVARAYEFMTYVAVSDWHHETTYHGHPCAGVTGLANPCPQTHAGFFTGPPGAPVSVHELDFDRLDAFRHDRAERGFR